MSKQPSLSQTSLRRIILGSILVSAYLIVAACTTKPEVVAVSSGEDQVYWTETKETIRVAYYTLSDQSVSLARLILPDGTLITLPQVPAASGVRYSDDFSYIWWTKGESASLDKKNDAGQWETKYANCVHIKPSSP